MNTICPTCSQPKVLCVCKELPLEKRSEILIIEQRSKDISIRGIKPSFMSEVLNQLRPELNCSGKIEHNAIQLRGHLPLQNVMSTLTNIGFRSFRTEVR